MYKAEIQIIFFDPQLFVSDAVCYRITLYVFVVVAVVVVIVVVVVVVVASLNQPASQPHIISLVVVEKWRRIPKSPIGRRGVNFPRSTPVS